MKGWIGILISSTAFLFQVKVLYPWHKEISNQFLEMELRINKKIENINKNK